MVGRGAAHRFKIHCRRRGAFYMRPCSLTASTADGYGIRPYDFVLAFRTKLHIFYYLLSIIFYLALFCVSEKGRGGLAAALCGFLKKSGLLDNGDAGQLLALQILQRGAAAGGDMGHLVGIAQLLYCGRGVAAADDGDGVRL